jgi:Subtilase family
VTALKVPPVVDSLTADAGLDILPRVRRVATMLLGLAISLALVSPALAAKTYNDPWLEGDLEQIRAPEALDVLARTPQHVIVGDVDSGARLSDPDLAPHLVRMSSPYTCQSEYPGGPSYGADPANGDFGCDFIGSGMESVPTTFPDGDPTDPYGHGTGTAAIIAAVPNNGIEGAGVAPNARVLPVRACYGGNPDCYNEPALDGLTYSVDMGASVINASWPPEGLSSEIEAFVHDNSNVLFDFAIGGSGQNEEPYPLCTNKMSFPNVICVGLANPDDTPGTVDANATTDVSAPGYAGVPAANGTRAEFGYTSGATAHVSGAAALLRGVAPLLSAATIREVLVSTSRHVAGYETANKADGIIDVEAAVCAVQQLEGLAVVAPGGAAPADSPDPFAGETTSGSCAPASTPVAPPAAPVAGPVASPTPRGGANPKARLTLLRSKLPRSVAAGSTLTVPLEVSGGTGTVTAALTHGKSTLAKATRRNAGGKFKLKLRIRPRAMRGRAKLTVRIGAAKPLFQSIKITKRT